MTKLVKSLEKWVSLGFIDKKQADLILRHESSLSQNSWVLVGFLILGIVVISVGIISLIAANWQQIPASIKLFADFSLLIICSLLILRAGNLKRDLQFDILLLFFILLCLASIGLIAQIYNANGEFYQALMLWSSITIVAFAAHRMFVPFIWFGGFLLGAIFTLLNSPLFYPVFQWNLPAVLMATTLFCACLSIAHKNSILTFTKETLHVVNIWFFIMGLISLACLEMEPRPSIPVDVISYSPGCILAIFLIFSILYNNLYRTVQKTILLLTLAVYFLFFYLATFQSIHDIVYAIFTLVILGLMAVFFASCQMRTLFQYLVIIIGIRFIILYFQALGGLAATGVGLIISGMFIIAMTILWHKYRLALAIITERWVR